MALRVEDYSSSNLIGSVTSKYSTDSIDTDVSADETGYLDFDGYLKVLVAQMSNQDFNNSMSDSEFIQQMASYSMMEAIKQLREQTALSYNSSLIGKAVTVTGSSGIPETGIVEAVTVTSKGCMLLVNGYQYSSDTVSDVVDSTVYSQLRQFIGHKVEVQYTDDKKNEITTSGKVTSVVVKGGNGYVVLDNKKMYDMSYITKLLDEEGAGDTSGTGTENEDGGPDAVLSDENGGSGLNGGNIGDTENAGDAAAAADNTQSAEVDENAAASAYSVQRKETKGVTSASQATYDTLMRMLDETTESNAQYKNASVLSQFGSASVKSNIDNMSYLLAEVEDQVAASGISSDRTPAPYVNGEYILQDDYTDSNETQESYIDGDYTYSENNISKAASGAKGYDSGDDYGVTSVSDSKASSASLETFSAGKTYENVPASSRKYADSYPVEAAFADSVGTNMVDIRFIGNSSINSVIDTSEIICYSAKGHAVTDIGFSGKGRLGEIVTFADGTQRVEILGGRKSGYLYTSGNYTLDEICNPHAAPGSLKGKLTDFEIAIRHYAREYTESEKAEMSQFEQYAVRHAALNGLG